MQATLKTGGRRDESKELELMTEQKLTGTWFCSSEGSQGALKDSG